MFATRGVSGVSVCQKYFNERETMKKEFRKGGRGRNKAKKKYNHLLIRELISLSQKYSTDKENVGIFYEMGKLWSTLQHSRW